MLLKSVVGRRWKNWRNPSRIRRKRRRGGLRETALESLEPRTLLSAAVPTADLENDQQAVAARRLAEATVDSDAPFPLSRTFRLSSDPRATHTIYLDFNGHVTRGTSWRNGGRIVSPAYNFQGTSANFTAAELASIQRIWWQVAEDFAPFDVDVTTRDLPVGRLRKTTPSDPRWGVRVVVTPDNSWYSPSAGGVAYINSFKDFTDTPAFVFLSGDSAAESISHEVGHTLGLSHDGQYPDEPYYYGHGTGPTSWAPIMGSAYYTELSQWSRGEYPNATQRQDDLRIITDPRLPSWQGLRYRRGDHGAGFGGAATLRDNGTTLLKGTGLIERTGDRDMFRFTTGGGETTIRVFSPVNAPNLDVQFKLFSGDRQLLDVVNPRSALDAAISRTLAAGTYYIQVDGVGKPRQGSDYGYTDYGSLGNYAVHVTRPPEPLRVTSIQFGYGNNRWIGGGQLGGRDAPWAIEAIRFGFNRNARVDAGDLTAIGEFAGVLQFGHFHYDPVRFLATWTLAEPVQRDRVRLTLDGDDAADDNADGVHGAAGGDYLQNGDFYAALDVLEGDVDGDETVDVDDQFVIRQRRQTSNLWADVNGDGIVDIADALLTQSHDGWTLDA